MQNYHNKVKQNFTAVTNTIVNDQLLSWKAKGIFLYLASKPDSWQFYMSDIEKRATDGNTSLKRGLKELESAGYLQRRTSHDTSGKFQGYVWTLFTDRQENRQTENPTDVKTIGRETALHSNTNKSNTDISNTKTNYQAFVDFWNTTYDTNYKLTKKKKEQINARLKTFTLEEIGIALRNRHDDTWLNTEGKDYLTSWDAFWRSDDKVDRYLNRKDEDELPF